ncbi:peptidyl-dipeptidase Dcp Metallo peptidase. MEROPS family M03A [Pseudidiomarina planktonica]|uniref:Peptidyl-dipeptidase Dcp Metallo peptidase. MEROPS family M03A n=1 Tax=Pseudidiomarina planktonica TaxID=1323738 RepID=A0A1Y6EVQ5_9GAMM|nr:M3 family metallopeptidase [Pseudidiomarina planktonica]RUO65072.1 M3 family peptidase [Pseudidiomarina planktonica]SMQ66795.1 peptidyl-dipeptidase Dcp Metallo peptidase. MEROPS family M03A [Pseudidiomarina planktonica]
MRKSLLAVAVTAALTVAACSDVEKAETQSTEAAQEQQASADFNQANPFYAPSDLPFMAPDFTKIKFEHYRPALLAGIEQHADEIELIANSQEAPTFDNTIVAMERAGSLLSRTASVFYNLAGSDSNDDMRALQTEMAPKLAAHSDNINLNADLFARVKSVYEQRQGLELNPEQVRLVEDYYKQFVRAGAQLNDEQQAEIRELNKELSSLTTEFQKSLMALVNENLIVVEDKAQLAGLSDARIQSLADAAKSRDMEGKYVITLSNTTRQSILGELENRELRQRVFEASANRGTGNTETSTLPMVKKLAELRADKAALLGYNSWGDYVLENSMAKTPVAAQQLLRDLVPAVISNVDAEKEAIQEMIEAEGGDFTVKPWDWAFYAEKVRAEKYALDGDQVKQYFEFNRVVEDGVFYAMNQLFGISFEKRDDIPVYHEDVVVYEVKDVDGETLGLFYGDWFTRDSKRGGAWMSSFVSQSNLMGHKPVILNNMNITKAPDGEPTLLSFDEVSTMFHEMGHALHGMFSDVMYPSLAGTSVSRDYVEFPSTFQEDWTLNEKVLNNYAKHYQTGEQIPKELLDKVLAARNFNQGYDTLEYIAAALLDLEYHTLSEDAQVDDVAAFEEAALTRNGVNYEAVPPRYRSPYFAHVFAGGYSAGYYAYMWSEILAADAFAYMQEQGGLTLENGQEFRNKILSQGNSKDPMQQYIDFRGQEPTVEALLERRGLTDPAID